MKRIRGVMVTVVLLTAIAAGYAAHPPREAADRGRAAGAASAPQAGPDRFDGFDDFVERARRDWKVPGAAIAVVQDGKVVLARGYGLRDVRANRPVTPDTRFGIG